MVTVQEVLRKSKALSASGLQCLAGTPSVNIAAGCVHGCLYCYTQGYRQYPGASRVVVYSNTAEQVGEELKRKRVKPRSVYFCPSCDAFQPVREVLAQTLRTMQCLLEHGVGVEFVTKGLPPAEFLSLFRAHQGLVSGQIGLASADESLAAMLEPGAPPVGQRLEAVRELQGAGVAVSVRADPLIHGLTDTDAAFDALVSACERLKVQSLAASYLFLRPAIRAALARGVPDKATLGRILAPYADGIELPVQGSTSCGRALPAAIRQDGFDRLRARCDIHGITLHVCGCKNADLTNGRCHLVAPLSSEKSDGLSLFSG